MSAELSETGVSANIREQGEGHMVLALAGRLDSGTLLEAWSLTVDPDSPGPAAAADGRCRGAALLRRGGPGAVRRAAAGLISAGRRPGRVRRSDAGPAASAGHVPAGRSAGPGAGASSQARHGYVRGGAPPGCCFRISGRSSHSLESWPRGWRGRSVIPSGSAATRCSTSPRRPGPTPCRWSGCSGCSSG